MELLLNHRAQYRVNHPKIAEAFFFKYMKGGKAARGYTCRFTPMAEKCAIELQTNSELNLNMIVRALTDAKIIKYKLPFETNKVIKMVNGRFEGSKYNRYE